ncbi:MAG: cobalamin biosynthesis protein CobD [Alphaproteobacteria bacterium]|nr:cobalamin biosynthesis protein CobD [Alphaproteobacteria bacterium]
MWILPSPSYEPMLVLLAALALDAVLGEVRWLSGRIGHPVQWIGRLISALELRLNRPQRSPRARRVRGAIVVAIVVLLAAAVAIAVTAFARTRVWGWALEAFVVSLLIAQRSLYDHVADVARALDREGLAGGRIAVARIVGRDPESLDLHGVARAAIESLAENFSDAVVAPVFWYALFGLPGLAFFKAASTLDSMIGHRNERYLDFGRYAARLDTAMNFLPARLSALLVALAALVSPGARPWGAARTAIADARKHRSVNAGWPEGAFAGALDLAIAGPRRYGSLVVDDPWIGSGRARATIADMRRALWLFAVACLVQAGLVAALAVARMTLLV